MTSGADKSGPFPAPPAPGLPPAVAMHRDSKSATFWGAVATVVTLGLFTGLYSLANGHTPPYAFGALVIAVTVSLMSAASVRNYVCAGPGWLLKQHLIGRSWVRTDQLVSLESSRAGVEAAMTFEDSDGRSVYLLGSDLTSNPRLLARVHTDARASLQAGAPLDSDVVAILAPLQPARAQGRSKGRRRR